MILAAEDLGDLIDLAVLLSSRAGFAIRSRSAAGCS
jgi:hypothetical protein